MRGPGWALVGVAAILLAAVFVLTGPASPTDAAPAPIKVAPIGDSLTLGINDSTAPVQPPLAQQAGYRDRLEERIQASGAAVDYIGRLSSGSAVLDDPDHEGVSGDTIAEISTRVVGWLGSLDAASAPDVVLLLAGTNDVTDVPVGETEPPADTQPAADALGVLVGDIAAEVPDAEIIVGTIPPHRLWNDRVQSYNSQLPAVIAARAAAGDDVRLVDTGSVIVDSDLVDLEHPDAFGYGKLADVWYRALSESYPELVPTLPATIANDDFDRADGPLGTAPSGQTWDESGSIGWSIVTNEAAAATGTGEGIAVLDVGQADVSVSASVRLPSTVGNPSLSFRATSSAQQLLAGLVRRPTENRIALFKIDGGAGTALAEVPAAGIAANRDYRLRVEASGELIQVWIDDVMWIEHTLSPADQATFGSATAHGMRALRTAGFEEGDSRWDDFEIRPTSLTPPPTTTTTTTTLPPGTPGYVPVDPTRVADTRDGGGARVPANGEIRVDVASLGGPFATAEAVTLNLGITEAARRGFAIAYPCGTRPLAASINFPASASISNSLVAELSPSGEVCVFVNQAAHVVVDVNGAFPPGSP